MMVRQATRGDGVGIEIAGHLIRGVRLSASEPGRLAAASEVAIESRDDDRSVVDALVRIRAELGEPLLPTRVAVFPPGSSLTRTDTTGLSGTELNQMRSELAAQRGIASTVLVDNGPRRWLIAVHWNDVAIRRLEDLTERAGFVDVAVDPAPLALARVVPHAASRVRRDAAPGVSVEMITSNGVPLAAATVDSVGRMTPSLTYSTDAVSERWFDDMTEPVVVVAEIRRLIDDGQRSDEPLQIAASPYPAFPPHDLRSPERQCVALGAAVGAAGLAGRLRPVDMVLGRIEAAPGDERPWAVERVSSLPPRAEAARIGPVKKLVSRILPRRRSDRPRR